MTDYLYLMQVSFAVAGFLAVFLVFRYQTIDTYADNRKEALRVIVDIRTNPERAEWIQQIGKSKNHDTDLINLSIPSVKTFIDKIHELRQTRKSLVSRGNSAILTWAILAAIYLLAHLLNAYNQPCYSILIILLAIPSLFTLSFMKLALSPSH